MFFKQDSQCFDISQLLNPFVPSVDIIFNAYGDCHAARQTP